MFFERKDLTGLGSSEVNIIEITNLENPGHPDNQISIEGITIPCMGLKVGASLKCYAIIEKYKNKNLTLVDIVYANIPENASAEELSKLGKNGGLLDRHNIAFSTRYGFGGLECGLDVSQKRKAEICNAIAGRIQQKRQDQKRYGVQPGKSPFTFEYGRKGETVMDRNTDCSTGLVSMSDIGYANGIWMFETGAAIFGDEDGNHHFYKFNYVARDETTKGSIITDCFYVFETHGKDLIRYLSEGQQNIDRFVEEMLPADHLNNTRIDSGMIPVVGGYDIVTQKCNCGFASYGLDGLSRQAGRGFNKFEYKAKSDTGRSY